MPTYYKGVAKGSHYWENPPKNRQDPPKSTGFRAMGVRGQAGSQTPLQHVARHDVYRTPYLSVTSSLAVARRYATSADGTLGAVWRIEVDEVQEADFKNPIAEIFKVNGKAHLHTADPLSLKPGDIVDFGNDDSVRAIFSSLADAEMLVESEIPEHWIEREV